MIYNNIEIYNYNIITINQKIIQLYYIILLWYKIRRHTGWGKMDVSEVNYKKKTVCDMKKKLFIESIIIIYYKVF